jgi:hypothetical protein
MKWKTWTSADTATKRNQCAEQKKQNGVFFGVHLFTRISCLGLTRQLSQQTDEEFI